MSTENGIPRLTKVERQVLLGIPSLFPDGEAEDLKIPGVDSDSINLAIQHLVKLDLATGRDIEQENPYIPNYTDVDLTVKGEQLRRNLERRWPVRFLAEEWKWIISNLMAFSALALSIWNFFHTTNVSRPELVSALPRINLAVHPEHLVVYWDNVGRKPARRGTAVLFTATDDGKHREKIGEAQIYGAGTNVIPGYSGQADFDVDMKAFLGRFLVCATYSDDSDVYNQAFLFKPTKQQAEGVTPLEELATPDFKTCQ